MLAAMLGFVLTQPTFGQVRATTDLVLYEANIRAFTPPNFNGVRARLDAIRGLGVNVLWLMPVYPVGKLKAGPDFGSPYAVQDYTGVNPEFGTGDDLKKLIAEAHQRGMAVMLDWVANHISWDNAWINRPGWVVKNAAGAPTPPVGTNWSDVVQLDYTNPGMRSAMIDAMKFWVKDFSVDGYRCDAADLVPTDFWRDAITQVRRSTTRPLVMLAEGEKNELLGAGFDLAFGWPFFQQMLKVYTQGASVKLLADADRKEYDNVPANSQRLRFCTNHDENAFNGSPITLFKGQSGAVSAFALAAYYRGVPLIYSGQEVGYPEKLSFYKHIPIDWSANLNMRDEITRIVATRAKHAALRVGRTEDRSTEDVVAIRRTAGTDQVLVFINVREQPTSFRTPTDWQSAASFDLYTNQAGPVPAEVKLNGFEVRVYQTGT